MLLAILLARVREVAAGIVARSVFELDVGPLDADLDPASRAYPFFTMSRKPPLRQAAKPFPSCVGRSRSPGSGGARRDRTDDLLLAKQALSQLSYGPVSSRPFQANNPDRERHKGLVGLERFELSTSRLSSARSNQLSYRPGKRGGRPNEERETKAAVSRRHFTGNQFDSRIGPIF